LKDSNKRRKKQKKETMKLYKIEINNVVWADGKDKIYDGYNDCIGDKYFTEPEYGKPLKKDSIQFILSKIEEFEKEFNDKILFYEGGIAGFNYNYKDGEYKDLSFEMLVDKNKPNYYESLISPEVKRLNEEREKQFSNNRRTIINNTIEAINERGISTKEDKVILFAYDLMKKHIGEDMDVLFVINPIKSLGNYNPSLRTITLDSNYVSESDMTLLKDTILHEIAHSLTPGIGHGKEWKAKCKELGCKQYAKSKILNSDGVLEFCR
jgi:hypothetical protein